MNTTIKTKEYKVDAKGRKLGRLASEVAVLLMGKNDPEYSKNVVADVQVLVSNAVEMDITAKKLKEKIYLTYSGYPGGQKAQNLEKVIADKGHEEALRRAVRGMLPANKLRPLILKNLSIN